MTAEPVTQMGDSFAYVNRNRTHEVLAAAEASDGAKGDIRWSVLERPGAKADANDVLVHEILTTADAVPGLVADLEARLAASGNYYAVTQDAAEPRPLRAKVNPDMRAHSVPIPDAPEGAFLEYFYFHGDEGRERVVLTTPREPESGRFDRFILAQYDFPAGRPRDGDLNIVHPRLAPELVVGHVAGEHLELPKNGFKKLFEPTEYKEALGDDWRRTAGRALESAATALAVPRAPTPPPEMAERFAAVPAAAVEAALRSPFYRTVRRRWLTPEEETAVFAAGLMTMHRFIRLARRRAGHAQQVELSLLEAGLTVEYGLAHGHPDSVRQAAPQLTRLAGAFGRA